MYHARVHDGYGDAFLAALKDKNIELLVNSKKDLNLLKGVYGNTNRYRHSTET